MYRQYFCLYSTYTRNSKIVWHIWTLYILNYCMTLGDIFFCVRPGCKIWWVTYGSKHSSQFFSISHSCLLIQCTRNLKTTALLSDTFLVWFRIARVQLKSYAPRHISVALWYKVVCVYRKPIYSSLFGAQLCMIITPHVLCDFISLTKRRLYSQRCIVLKKWSWLATLHISVSFQWIMYTNITTVYTALWVCCQVAKKGTENRVKNFCQN